MPMRDARTGMQTSRRRRIPLLTTLLAVALVVGTCGVDPEITVTSGTEAPSATASPTAVPDDVQEGDEVVGEDPDEPIASADLEALGDAERRWADSGITDYSYTLGPTTGPWRCGGGTAPASTPTA